MPVAANVVTGALMEIQELGIGSVIGKIGERTIESVTRMIVFICVSSIVMAQNVIVMLFMLLVMLLMVMLVVCVRIIFMTKFVRSIKQLRMESRLCGFTVVW